MGDLPVSHPEVLLSKHPFSHKFEESVRKFKTCLFSTLPSPSVKQDAELQRDFFLCAGLCILNEGVQGNSVASKESAVDLVIKMHGSPEAALEAFKRRPQLKKVKEACVVLETSSPPKLAVSLQKLTALNKMLSQNCHVSKCQSKSDTKKWKIHWSGLHKLAHNASGDRDCSSPSEAKTFLDQVAVTMVKEFNGYHFYMVFRHFRWIFCTRGESPLYKTLGNDKSFQTVIDKCEEAYVVVHEALQKRVGLSITAQPACLPKREEKAPFTEPERNEQYFEPDFQKKIQLKDNRYQQDDTVQNKSLTQVESDESVLSEQNQEKMVSQVTHVAVAEQPELELELGKQKEKCLRQEKEQNELRKHLKKCKQTIREEIENRQGMEAEVARLQKALIDKTKRKRELETLLQDALRKNKLKSKNEKQLSQIVKENSVLALQLQDETKKWNEEREKIQHKTEREKTQLLNAVEKLETQMNELRTRHQVEVNRWKSELAAKATKLQRQQDKHFEDAQKRLAGNAQVEQLSDPNRPSEVARRYADLFQRTYDVAEALEDKDIEEDDCNKFIVEMLSISIDAAKSKLTSYETYTAESQGLSESFLRLNSTAHRIVRESVISLLKLASAANKEKDARDITKAALEAVKKNFSPPYCSQEIAPIVEKFLVFACPIVWEVAIFSQPAVFVLTDTIFDEAKHEHFTGSNLKSEKISVVVWPPLVEQFTGKTLCKGKVVTSN